MKFLIRDDDPCGFTSPEELTDCYDSIWDYIPVNFSVTPFRIPSNDKNVPESLYGSEVVIPLEKNSDLVDLLKDKYAKGAVDFALHGYNHIKLNGLPEYVAASDLYEKTKEGKKYIENILNCNIQTFVPPHNTITRKGFDAVVKNKMNLVGTPSFLRQAYRPFEIGNVSKYIKQKYYNSRYNINYPYRYEFDDHMEVNFVSITPSQTMENIKQALMNTYKLNGIFIFAVHYHAFNKSLRSGELIKDVLNEVIDITNNMTDVEYISYKELWKLNK